MSNELLLVGIQGDLVVRLKTTNSHHQTRRASPARPLRGCSPIAVAPDAARSPVRAGQVVTNWNPKGKGGIM